MFSQALFSRCRYARFVLFTLVAAARFSAAVDRIETIEGVRAEGNLVAVNAAGSLVGSGFAAEHRWEDLRSLRRSVDTYEAPAKGIVESASGGVLPFVVLSYADDRFQLTLCSGTKVSPSIDEVRSLRFDAAPARQIFLDALAKPEAEIDRVFVKTEESLEAVTGLLTSIDDKTVALEIDGKVRNVSRDKIYGIVPAQGTPAKKASALVTLDDGTRFPGKVAPPENGILKLAAFGGNLELPWESVAAIDFHSPRLLDLAAQEPQAINEQTYLTLPAPFRRNLSVSGTPLMLGTTAYARGLGVHSRSELTFDLPANAEAFLAVIGIDAATMGRGDCEFHVLGDGRSLYRERVRGGEEPRNVRLECRGVKKLTLLVEPGEEFDLADHANWCDCRLLLQAKP